MKNARELTALHPEVFNITRRITVVTEAIGSKLTITCNTVMVIRTLHVWIDTILHDLHPIVVELAKWQLPGIDAAINASKQVTMGEFNTASCGGIVHACDPTVI